VPRLNAFAIVPIFLVACGDPEPMMAPPAPNPDAAVAVDTGPPDTGIPPDAGVFPDAGHAFNQSACLDCDSGCAGGTCIRTGAGESFCADSCDADLDGCLAGYTCFDLMPNRVCVPPRGTCMSNPKSFGTPCLGDTSLCFAERGACQGDLHAVGYCTDPCFGAGCPAGFECAAGDDGDSVCRATFAAGAERCGQESDPAETPCVTDADCSGALCVGAIPGRPGVCGSSCDAATACAAGQVCKRHGDGAACVPERCACRGGGLPLDAAPGTRDLLQDVLTEARLDRCSALFSVHDWAAVAPEIAHDPYRLGFFDAVHNEPLKAPAWGRAFVGELDDAAATTGAPTAKAARLVEALATLADRPASGSPVGAIDMADPLATAVAELISAAGGAPDAAALRADAADIPLPLQRAMATVVDGIRRAHLARNQAFAGIGAQQVIDLFRFGPAFLLRNEGNLGINPTGRGIPELLNEGIGYGQLYSGGVDVLDAIAMAELDRFAVAPTGTGTVATATATLMFDQMTPIGRVAIGDGGSGIYDERRAGFDGAWALLVDLGGHDTYRVDAGGNASSTNTVSVLIDLGGRDRYGYVEVPHPLDGDRLPADADGRLTPPMDADTGPISFSDQARQGSGRAGVGVLLDLGGDDDRYTSLRMSQGSGIFGVGVLVDDGGDDRYEAEAMSQGAGSFGIGVLLDLAGNDERRAYQASQGFAFARAAGLLYDTSGDDRYLMDVGDPMHGGDPLYPAAQRANTSNATLGQGFAFGRRDDRSGGYMSGGVGLLVDADGNDLYEGSIFAQGGGFWFGTGILADERGNDSYDGLWYAMGAGAHFAMGLLLEGGGDDVYGARLPPINVTIAGGHDFSTAAVIDEGGDDRYNGSRITLGSGNVNGIGLFVDNAGDDVYTAKSLYGIGAAGLLEQGSSEPGAPRRRVATTGLFIDASGTDTYADTETPSMISADDTTWGRPQTDAAMDPSRRANERAAGVDGDGDSTIHVRW